MARGVNKVTLIGNLGQAPEKRFTPTGRPVTTVSVATSESWKDKKTGDTVERTEWHRVVFWDRLAEIACDYLKKGSKVYIEGSNRTRPWKDKDGVERYTTEIIAGEMQMLDSKDKASGEATPASAAQPQAMPGNDEQTPDLDWYDENMPT